MKTQYKIAVLSALLMGAAHAQLLETTIHPETQSVVAAGENLSLTLYNVTRNIEQQVSQSHVTIFEDLGQAGTKALLAQTLAKGAANVSQLTLGLTPAEAVRVMTAVQDLAAGNAANTTVADLTPKEQTIAQFVALSASTYTLPETKLKENEAFTVAIQPDGSVVATTVVVEVTAPPESTPEP